MNISSLSKATKLSLLSYLNQAISILLAFIEVKIVTSILSINDYGVFNQIHTTVALVTLVLSLNLGHGFLRFASSYPIEKKIRAFHTVIITQVTLTIIAALIFLPFQSKLIFFLTKDVSALYYFFIIAISIMTFSINITQNYQLAIGNDIKMVKQNLISIIANATFITLGTILLRNAYGALWGYLTNQVLFFLYLTLKNKMPYKHIAFSKDIFLEIAKFSIPLISVSIAYFVINSSNRYLINFFIGLDAVARFSVANRLPMMLITIFTLLSTVFLSNLSRLYDNKDYSRVEYWMSMMIRIFIFVTIPATVFLVVTCHSITLLVSNENFMFDHLGWFYLLMCLGSIIYGLFLIISKLFDLSKQVKTNSSVWTSMMVINICLNLALLPSLGLLGTVYAFLITFVIGFAILMYCKPQQININVNWIKILLYMIIGSVISMIYDFIRGSDSIILELALGLLTMILTAGIGYMMKIVNKEEMKYLIFNKR